MHADSGTGGLFGSTQELILFGEIFFGTLAVALVFFVIMHKKSGLPLPGEGGFDWMVLGLGLWCFTGMATDGWGHLHGAVDDSFFTPWHAIWYSGFTAYASFITFALWRLHDGPIPLTPSAVKEFLGAMPAGWSASVWGMIIFSLGGFGDMLWHTFLGIEGGTDILLSTTHIMLVIGLSLTLMAPFWAAWNDNLSGTSGLKSQLPMLFAIGAVWSIFTLFTNYTHHQTLSYNDICASLPTCNQGNIGLERGVSAILIQSVIISSVVLLFMRRWRPTFGTFSVLLGVNGLAIAAFAPGELKASWKHFIAPLLTGLILDLAYRQIDPISNNRIRFFAFLVPSTQVLVWMLVLLSNTGWAYSSAGDYPVMAPLGWSVHATIGVIFISGCIGVLMSIISNPPKLPSALAEDSLKQ